MNFTKSTTTPLRKFYNRLSDNVKADLSANSSFWKRYDSKVAEVSGQINDHYLKANGQSDGIKSYDRMVDLMNHLVPVKIILSYKVYSFSPA